MKAFLLSIAALLVVVFGAHYGLKPFWDVPSEKTFSTANVRLN